MVDQSFDVVRETKPPVVGFTIDKTRLP
jgi:hypothetical protein